LAIGLRQRSGIHAFSSTSLKSSLLAWTCQSGTAIF
jgi:hypothetical protein